MRVCLFFIFPLVMVSGLQSQTLKTHILTESNQYSGYACSAPDRVFDIDNARSRSDCVLACANSQGCLAIFYVETLKRCIGCNSANFGNVVMLEPVTGSVCFVKGSGCTAGWTRYLNSCYYFNLNATMTFTDAKSHCASMGAHVVVPDDADENQFIRNMTATSTSYVWSGIERVTLNTWLSYHDNTTVTYLPWRSPGEPNGQMFELCVLWLPNQPLWDDAPCNYAAIVACEKELGN